MAAATMAPGRGHMGPGRSHRRYLDGLLNGEAADMQSQAFWSELMRRPDAQAAYHAEQRLLAKKAAWLQERKAIEVRAEHRRAVADALEEAPADVRKLIAPIFHIRIVEQFLWEILDECQKRNQQNPLEAWSFVERLQTEKNLKELRAFRQEFQEGGVKRMEEIEKQNKFLNDAYIAEEEKKRIANPERIDMKTLKQLLEYAQECKFEGNRLYKEGLYEEALEIYSQADDAMKKWKVDGHLKNELKWLTDSHLACLKNKSQAALSLELFQTALDAAEDALKLDIEDHKAWFRKVQALKGLGKFKEAEEALVRLEDVGQWCPDRHRILRDCENERKRLHIAAAKSRISTKEMLGKAFAAGVFSIDREKELEEAAKRVEDNKRDAAEERRALAPSRSVRPGPLPLTAAVGLSKDRALPKPKEETKAVQGAPERSIQLTAALAGDLMDDLAAAYSQQPFQDKVRKCARNSGYERAVFLMRLKDLAFEVQKPVLENWGFEGTEQGVREMTGAIRDHAKGKEMPKWLKEKEDRCLELLYGGKDSEMCKLLTS
mmetsp:Transcript_136236/g.235826  ORF Transcript_136236/g.235826 Transcript_136236/m.235826 type:complete len:547 (+) Transcript_136236:67-1707(+)